MKILKTTRLLLVHEMTECVILDSIPIHTKASVVDKFVGV